MIKRDEFDKNETLFIHAYTWLQVSDVDRRKRALAMQGS